MTISAKNYLEELKANPHLLDLNNALDTFFEKESKSEACAKKALQELCSCFDKGLQKSELTVFSEIVDDIFNNQKMPQEEADLGTDLIADSSRILTPPSSTGIVNRGNTCFMASALQFLASSDAYFVEISKEKKFTKGPKQLLQIALKDNLVTLLTELRKGDEANADLIQRSFKNIHENSLITGPGLFRRGGQDDAFSFITHLLTQIECDTSASHHLVQKRVVIAGTDTDYELHGSKGEIKPFIELQTTAKYEGKAGQSTSLQDLIDDLQNSCEELTDFTYNGTKEKETVSVSACYTHPNIEKFKEIPVVLPRVLKTRTATSYTLTKLQGSITGLLDPCTIRVKNGVDNKHYSVQLKPKSYIVHLGALASGGHYVELEALANGQFIQKSDGSVTVINRDTASEMLKSGAVMVNMIVARCEKQEDFPA